MRKRKVLTEVFVLRAIACLSVVLLHSIGLGLETLPTQSISDTTLMTYDSLGE